jgi:hypothetical protein
MSKYPKGCRWVPIYDGEVGTPLKTTHPKGIRELFHDSPMRGKRGYRFVAVQPRGHMQWYLFKRVDLAEPELIAKGKHRDALVMRAALS